MQPGLTQPIIHTVLLFAILFVMFGFSMFVAWISKPEDPEEGPYLNG